MKTTNTIYSIPMNFRGHLNHNFENLPDRASLMYREAQYRQIIDELEADSFEPKSKDKKDDKELHKKDIEKAPFEKDLIEDEIKTELEAEIKANRLLLDLRKGGAQIYASPSSSDTPFLDPQFLDIKV